MMDKQQPRPMVADSAGEAEPCRKCNGRGYTRPGDPETGETWLDNLCVDCAVPAPVASPAALTDGARTQLEDVARHPYGGRFSVYLSGAEARALLAAQPPAAAEAEKRDAERYRWLRIGDDAQVSALAKHYGSELDDAIDAAMSAGAAPTEEKP